jgi:hypothetical protein
MELIWTGFGGVVLKQRHKSQHCPANLWFDGWILSNLDSSASAEEGNLHASSAYEKFAHTLSRIGE